jgi:reactive intermediate/imine deaminase
MQRSYNRGTRLHRNDIYMTRSIISTPNAPQAIGTYSQAVKCGSTLYVSGQIPLDPATAQLVTGDMEAQIRRVFENLKAILNAANADFSHVAKLNVFLTDLSHFALVNKIMSEYFREPYPARAAIGVAALPKGAQVEMDCVAEL